MLISSWLRSVQTRLRYGRRMRLRRSDSAPTGDRIQSTEQLEERALLTPQLIGVLPNDGVFFDLNGQNSLDVAPDELVFQFNGGEDIDVNSAINGGLQFLASGNDGVFGDANDRVVTPGYIGVGVAPNELVVRFGETLKDDVYQITAFGANVAPLTNLTNTAGEVLNGVDVNGTMVGSNTVLNFQLDLGAKITGIVPQPVSRDANGVLTQQMDQIVVHFNDDDLDPASAQDPRFYNLIYTHESVTSADDTATQFEPTSVVYDAAADTATLTFATDIHLLPGASAGTFRLRIGNDESVPTAPVTQVVAADPGSSYRDANTQIGDLAVAGNTSQIINGLVAAQLYSIEFPGAVDEPGHRLIEPETHLLGGADTTGGTSVFQYNFASSYGFDPLGNELFNVITELQKERAREIFEFYSETTGLDFVETASDGLQIVTGDLRALDPAIPTGPGGVAGLAGGGLAIMDNAESWTNEPNGSWFNVAFHEIGHLLGLGHSYELPPSTIQGDDGAAGNGLAEAVFPGNNDVVHLKHLFRPDSIDVDMYQFDVSEAGAFTAETIAERSAESSLLDTHLRLFELLPDGSHQLVAQNDDYFSEDSLIGVNLEPGTYFIGVSSTGNDDYDPTIANTGFNGTSNGTYELRLDFRPSTADSIVDLDATVGDDVASEFDGDSDGVEGGVYNFWFNAQPETDVILVDKTPGASRAGGLPLFSQIDAALAASTPGQIVRILGNFGTDGIEQTPEDPADAIAYQIGVDSNNVPLIDGNTFDIPKDRTVMIDGGAVLKFRNSNIGVGSSLATVDRSGSGLQILGTPVNEVYLTSQNNENIGGDTTPAITSPRAADWGGIAFQNDVDYRSTNFNYEREGIFLNYVNHATISYGGGTVLVDSSLQTINALHLTTSRPTLSYNTLINNADSGISADPDSFGETRFTTPEFQRGSEFSLGYDRVGPDIHDNTLTNNSTNGLFVRVVTAAGTERSELTVAGHFDDRDITHVIAETLQVSGTPGGGFFATEAPPMDLTFVSDNTAGSLAAGTYDYRLVFVTDNGFEGPSSVVTNAVTPTNGGLRLNNLPAASAPFSGRRLYRSDGINLGGAGDYTLVAQLDASGPTYLDDGTTSVGTLVPQTNVLLARTDASLIIDPGVVVKSNAASIQVENSAQLIAEGVEGQEIIFTSLRDDRFGRGGTFDTNNDDASETDPSAGDWGGLYAGYLSSLSLDHTYVAFGGGATSFQGGFSTFNAVEIHQATARITNSEFESNASGVGVGAAVRSSLGPNSAGTIFVRGAQPIVVNNVIRDNFSAGLSINVNSLTHELNRDVGRSTGPADLITEYGDNAGPLIRDNIVDRNTINGMEVRAETLTVESVWDDADIVHVVRNEIYIPDFHTFGGLRLQSTPDSSLVVKFAGANAGITANGRPLDISDRIGGMLHIVGQPGNPVVLTSLNDDADGAGFGLDGLPHNDTNNDGIDLDQDGFDDRSGAPVTASVGSPGDWRGIVIDEFASDRNVGIYIENETNISTGGETNNRVLDAEILGTLASKETNSDENLRIGFEVHGSIKQPGDLDIYSFSAVAGSEVWLDIDFSRHAFDPVVELLDSNGNVVAISDNSIDESAGTAALFVNGAVVNPMERSPLISFDGYTTNQRDAGFRVVLPGNPGFQQNYFVRVRSSNIDSLDTGANRADLADPTKINDGLTSGSYQLQVRINEIDEQPGSTVRYSKVRFAVVGIEVKGQPSHSPLTGEFAEVGDIGAGLNSADLGNLLNTDRAVLSIAGRLDASNDVDTYTFDVNYDSTQTIADVSNTTLHVPVVIDLDYADGFSRANTVLSLFDDTGQLIWIGRDSNVVDDQGGPLEDADVDDLSRGSNGILDGYIGPIELPVGTYHLAVSSNDFLPEVVDQFTSLAAASTFVRLEPINSLQRIAEERFDNTATTTATDPLVDLFGGNIDDHVVPWHLGDVGLYISTTTGTTGGNRAAVQHIDPFTGERLYRLGQINQSIGDIAMRPDGELFTYSTAANNGSATDGTSGNYLQIDVSTGGVTNVGDDGITTNQLTLDANGAPVVATQNVGVQFEAILYNGAGANDGFAVGNRRAGNLAPNTPAIENIMYRFNTTTGAVQSQGAVRAAGPPDTRLNGAATNFVEVGHLNVGDADGNGVIDTVSGMARLDDGSIWAVTEEGFLYQVTAGAAIISGPTPIIDPLLGAVTLNFAGLAAGPDAVENGKYAQTLFGISNNGTLVAFDTTGALQPVFLDGATSLNTGLGGVTGLDFSTLDRNLWNVTTARGSETGHGVTLAPDDSRAAVLGGTSLYFGNQTAGPDAGNRNNLGAGTVRNVNFPGGAYGGIVSNEFSLEGYAAADTPVLYFNYLLDTEDTNFNPTNNQMRDSFRVYVGSDTTLAGNGRQTSWSLVSTNNSFQSAGLTGSNQDEFDLTRTGEYDSTFPSGQSFADVQPLFENGWRQARVDLSNFAGTDNLRLRFEFSTAGSVGVGSTLVGSELRALPGSELHAGEGFLIDTDFFVFDMGFSLIAPSGPAITEGETFNIDGTIFELDSDGTLAGGIAIPFTVGQTPVEIAQQIQNTLAANGIASVLDDNRVNLTAAVAVAQSGGTSITLESAPAGVGIPVPINAASTREEVAQAIQQALADTYANGETDAIKQSGDLVRIIGHTVNFAGPLPFTNGLPGDSDFATFNSIQRAQNNAVEGVFVDDLIIGFAERGEMVTSAGADTDFTLNGEINNPGVSNNPNQDILVGSYDLELRRATVFGHGESADIFPFQTLTTAFDTNDRFVQRTTLTVPPAHQIADGQTFTLSDGDTVLTFEFEDSQLANGVAPGNIQVLFDPQITESTNLFGTAVVGSQSSFEIARAIRDAINSPAAQSNFDVAASMSDGSESGSTSTSSRVAISGVAVFEPGTSGVTATNFDFFGDNNVHREQGQILIESNTITDSLEFGISVNPGDRDPANADDAGILPHPGALRNLQEANGAREVPGVVIFNNVIAFNGNGAIEFSGDGGPDAPAPYGRIINNTLFGTPGQTGTGVSIVAAKPTLLNNIIAGFNLGVSLSAGGGAADSASAVIGYTLYQNNGTNSNVGGVGAGSFAIQLGLTDPLFVDEANRNFYLAPLSQAIDSSLDTLGDRQSIIDVKSPLGISPSPILSPDLDVFGQKRASGDAQSSGAGSNIFKDRGAIDRVDFTGPFATLTTPEDQGANDLFSQFFHVVWIDDPTRLRAFVLQLEDAGIGVDDQTIESTQFMLLQNDVLLVEDVDYQFIYNSTTDEVIFRSITEFDTDARYEIVVDNNDDATDGQLGVRDIAGNFIQPNQADSTTRFRILLTDGENDAPINSVPESTPPLEILEDTDLVFTAASMLGISISDADADIADITSLDPLNDPPGQLIVTLTATNGTLTLGDSSTVMFTTGDGTSDLTMTFLGTLAELNTALEGTIFTPDADYFGAATVTITTNDQGNFSAPPVNPEEDTDVININVLPVNDAPRVTLAGDQTVIEDSGSQVVTNFATIDVVEAGQVVTNVDVTWTVLSGNVAFDSDPEIDRLTGTLTYQTAIDTNGVVEITMAAFDDGLSAPAPNVNKSLDMTFLLNVTAINDAPVFTIPGQAPISLEDTGLQTVPNFATAIQTARATATDEHVGAVDPVTGVPTGQALVSFTIIPLSTTGNLTFVSGPTVDLATGELTYEATADTAGTAQFSIVLTDNGLGTPIPNVNVTAHTFNINVEEVNDPPTFNLNTIPPVTVDEDAGPQTIVGFADNISAGTVNEDALVPKQTISFSATVIGTTGTLTFASGPTIDPVTGNLTFTSDDDTNGTALIEVIASDDAGGDNASPPQLFVITVNAINDAPTATVPANAPGSLEDSGPRVVTGFVSGITPGPIDEVNQTPLTSVVTVIATTNGLTFVDAPAIDPVTGDLTYRADPNSFGTATIQLVLTDTGSGVAPNVNSSTHTFVITVNQVANPATLEGRKFHDLNASGTWEANEPFLNGWVIELYNDLGLLTATMTTADRTVGGVTEAGWYVFNDVAPISHTISEVLQTDWTQSFPTNGDPHAVTPTLGTTVTDLDFGNYVAVTITGRKFHDINGNAARDAGDTYLNNWQIELLDSTGTVIATTTTADTNLDADPAIDPETETGWYEFVGVIPGDYTIREVIQTGWGSSLPVSGEYNQTLISAQDVEVDFGNYLFATISGQKFHDRDANGINDAGDEFLNGWTIELVNQAGTVVDTVVTADFDLDSDGTTDPIAEAGVYTFTNVIPGSYTIREVIQTGWAASTPVNGSLDVVVLSDDDQSHDFGNYEFVRVAGRKYLDLNADGAYQVGEEFLNGWTIELVDTTTDTVVATTTTADIDFNANLTIDPFVERGWFVFENVVPGTYEVREEDRADWTQTAPITDVWTLTLLSGDNVETNDFGNFSPGEISGRKFHDLNANGQFDINEPYLDNWSIELLDATGTVIITTTTTSIDLDGNNEIDPLTEVGLYSFTGLVPGDYSVREVIPTGLGWVQSLPGTTAYDLTIGNGGTETGIDFGNFQTASITGLKYHDINGNGTRDNGESPLANFTIQLIDAGGNQVDAAITGTDGVYAFADLTPGTYSVRELVPFNWKQSEPATASGYTFNLSSGTTITGQEFGNFQPASITGRKFEDLNADGVLEDGEPLLNGWQIELVNAGGVVVATSITENRDLNLDGQINPNTERGWYSFTGIVAGDYVVREVIPDGWQQSLPGGSGEYALTLLPLQAAINQDFGNYRPGAIRGRKWEDLNGDGIRSTNEPYLNGWTIELVDDTGTVVAQTTTGLDLDGQNGIDPITEAGLYVFTDVTPGDWTIREVLQDGWSGTVPNGGVVAEQALALDIQFEFYDDGSAPVTVQFVPVKWFRSATDGDAWYFLSQGGQLFKWDTVPGSQSGTLIASLGPAYYNDPSLLTNPQPSGAHVSVLDSGQNLANVDFGNYQDVRIDGRKYHDTNSNGQRDATEAYLNGWTIELRTANGALVNSAVTADVDLNGDGSIDPTLETGIYAFENLAPGDWVVTEVNQTGWVRSAPSTGGLQETAFELDNRFGFFFTGNLFQDTYGADEKWVRASEEVDRWFYILPDGGVYRWSEIADSATGTLVGTLDATFWENPEQLYRAEDPGTFQLTAVSGDEFVSQDFGNYELDGSIEGRKFHDIDGDGIRDAGEEFLNGWTIQVSDATGSVVGSATTASVDRNNDGSIDPETETGWYRFDNLEPGTFTVTEVAQAGWSTLAPQSATIGAGRTEFNVDFGNWQFASISGRKYHDANANGIRETGEAYLNGWTVKAVDANGNEVGSAVTANVDLNNDGSIDPETETGWYTITGLDPGQYQVDEVLQDGWFQSAPGLNQFGATAANLDDTWDISLSGSLFENWGGLNERWLRGAGGNWFFITPNGELYLWDSISGAGGFGLQGSLLATFPTSYYDNPALIAEPVDSRVSVVSNQTVTGLDFGNYQNGEIRGRTWNDLDADGLRDANEPYLNNWTVELIDASGTVVQTTRTANLDLDGNGTITPETEAGWYQFTGLRPAEYFVQEQLPAGNWLQTGAVEYESDDAGAPIDGFAPDAYTAWRLDQEFQFVSTGNDWQNWGSEQERWLFSQATNSWAYVTTTGALYQWDGSSGRGGATPLDGQLIAQLDDAYYDSLDLLYAPIKPAVSVLSNQVTRGFDFGNFLDNL